MVDRTAGNQRIVTTGLTKDIVSQDNTQSLRMREHHAPYPSNSLQFLRNQSPSPKISLKVVVVGAGLGGLATAIAFARSGHRVEVLEQASKLGEVEYHL